MTPEELSNNAFKIARMATEKYLDENPHWYPCGFAWVRIRPARGKFVAYLKEQKLGSIDSYEGGFVVYNPSNNPTQAMHAKLAGAQAFADFLCANGIKAHAESRVD